MAIEHLIKGEPNWHNKVNANMDDLQEQASSAGTTATEAKQLGEGLGESKLDKPVDPEFDEGYVYQEPNGSTSLRRGGFGPDNHFKYTMIIDNGSDGNPGAVTYADDCAAFMSANVDNMGDWADTDLYKEYFKPCVIGPEDAVPKYYLRKNNMTLKEDGTNANLTGTDGDVMIEIKRLYGKVVNQGSKVKMILTNYREDDGFFCFNDIGSESRDVMYRGAYEASVLAAAPTVMRSVSGQPPVVSQTKATMRGYARNRGTDYHQNNIYMLFLYQWMYLLLYRNRNSQSRLGQGRTLATNTSAVNTGTLNTKPFCWGDQGGVNGVKFLGVENFYGNVWEFVDGVVLNALTWKLTKDPAKYDDVGTTYEISVPSGLTANNTNKYITQIAATNDLCFLPRNSGGSASTFFCDNMWVAAGVQIVFFGAAWNDAARAGAFCWHLAGIASLSDVSLGSRLCRK